MFETLISVVLLGSGLMVGSLLPDIDLAPVLPIRHRSFWTHGPWLSIVFIAGSGQQWAGWDSLWLGLLLGLALHLLNDASPKSWRGASHINLFPLPWSLSAWFSWLYILSSGFATMWVVVTMLVGDR